MSSLTSQTVSASTVDITPSRPMALFGFGSRHGHFTAVRTRLEANILTLSSGESLVHLVSIDTLYGGEIQRRLVEHLRIAPENVLVVGSHTHFAPGVDAGLARLGPTDPDYVDDVVTKIARSIENARPLVHGDVSWATGSVDGLFTNRRRPSLGLGLRLPGLGRVVTAPHRRGRIDDRLRAAIIGTDGLPTAILWGVSCHPVCTPTISALSADFPGEVRRAIRNVYGRELPVLFLQGFGADVVPLVASRRPLTEPKQLLYYLAAGGVRFVEQSESSYVEWCEKLGRRALSVLEGCRHPAQPLMISVARVRAEAPTEWTRPPTMQRIQVARGLSVVGVNAEVVSERVVELEAMARNELTIPAGCCDEVFGYWPTDQMRKNGGYEAEASRGFFPPIDFGATAGADQLWYRTLGRLLEASVSTK